MKYFLNFALKSLCASVLISNLGFSVPHKDSQAHQELNMDLPHPDFMVMDLYTRSENTLEGLRNIAEKISARIPCTAVVIPPLKGANRAEEKVNADYGGDWSRLMDIVRGSISFDTLEDLKRGLEIFKEESNYDIVAVKNRFDAPLKSGYRDILCLFYDRETKVIGEMQFHLCSILKQKGDEHKAYEIVRSMQAEAAIAQRELSEEEKNQILEIQKMSRSIYEKALSSAEKKEACNCQIQRIDEAPLEN